MPVDPIEVVAGGWYRTEGGEDRLVWTIRDGGVCYFHKVGPDQAWLCTQPPDPAPAVDAFAAEVDLVHLDGAAAAGAVDDAYGGGDW